MLICKGSPLILRDSQTKNSPQDNLDEGCMLADNPGLAAMGFFYLILPELRGRFRDFMFNRNAPDFVTLKSGLFYIYDVI